MTIKTIIQCDVCKKFDDKVVDIPHTTPMDNYINIVVDRVLYGDVCSTTCAVKFIEESYIKRMKVVYSAKFHDVDVKDGKLNG